MGDPLSIYTAGGWYFRQHIKNDINTALQDAGHNVISGWIERENDDYTPTSLAIDARYDVDEVQQADVFFAVMEDTKYAYRGTFCELGVALGSGKRNIMILCDGQGQEVCGMDVDETAREGENAEFQYSHYCMTNPFFHHEAIVHVQSMDAALEQLRVWKAEKQLW